MHHAAPSHLPHCTLVLSTLILTVSPSVQYQANQHCTFTVKAVKSSNKTSTPASPVPTQTLHILSELLTWISTDSPSEVHPARQRPRPPHPSSYPPSAHIICFGLLGDTSLWRGTEKLFKLHKHNVALAPTGCWWWMGTAHRPQREWDSSSSSWWSETNWLSGLYSFKWKGRCGHCWCRTWLAWGGVRRGERWSLVALQPDGEAQYDTNSSQSAAVKENLFETCTLSIRSRAGMSAHIFTAVKVAAPWCENKIWPRDPKIVFF